MARIFQASVLTGNWDVVGMSYDNVMLGKNGRLAMIDAGGSFKFRAQGGAKAYEAVPNEVNTLRDAKLNPQAASVFNAIFGKDVWLEREGAKPLLELKKTDVKKVFANAGFQEAEAKGLTETLWSRRQWLVERYDLEGSYVRKDSDALEEFKKWGTGAFTDVLKEANGSTWSRQLKASCPELGGKFETYIEHHVDRNGVGILRDIFHSEWSASSCSKGGAVLKKWASTRFGISCLSGGYDVEAHCRDFFSRKKTSQEAVFAVLDAEYEFHQYYLRRLHLWDPFSLERGTDRSELRQFKKGTFSGNAVASFTTKNGVFGSKPIRFRSGSVRVEDVVKTWYQGSDYMSYYQSEAEYILLGRPRPTERLW
jgi:hypothetical protein